MEILLSVIDTSKMLGLFQFVQHHKSFLKLHIRIVKRYPYEPNDKCFHEEATFQGLGEHEISQERIILFVLFCFVVFFFFYYYLLVIRTAAIVLLSH